MKEKDYRSIYYDIINGYSLYNDNKKSFVIKHFDLKDLNLVNKKRIEIESKALKLGLLDEKNQINNLIEKDNWSQDKEDQIIETRQYLKDLKYTKSKLVITKDLDNINKQIEEAQEKINKFLKEREELLGTTLESYTDKKINEYYVYISLYKDENLKEKYLTQKEFEDLEYEELFQLYAAYNFGLSNLVDKNIKKIALSNFFLNVYYLCDDNPYSFFGKPIIDLTFTQAELFSYGKYFKNIMTNSTTKPPDNVMNDPDSFIDWYEGSKNINTITNKNKSKNKEALGSSIIGASEKDLKKIGMENKEGISLIKEAEKKGGALSLQDLIKLHNA